MININWNPTIKKLREFGIVTMTGFTCIGMLFLYFCGGRNVGTYIAITGGILGALTIVVPKLMRWFYLLWMGIAFVMGNIVSRVLIAVVYYVVCTIISLFMKLVGRDRLMLKPQECESYWKDCVELDNDKEAYERLF